MRRLRKGVRRGARGDPGLRGKELAGTGASAGAGHGGKGARRRAGSVFPGARRPGPARGSGQEARSGPRERSSP